MEEYEIEQRISHMLASARQKAGASRKFMSEALNVSTKTVQNWEEAVSIPNAKHIMKWFDALGLPIYPYLFKINNPGLETLNANSTDEQVKKALLDIISTMDISSMRKHFFELVGNHGTAPDGMGEVKTAYLHLPMDVKVGIAEIICTQFLICQAQGRLVQPDKVMPDTDKLQDYINKAKTAVINGKETYL